MPFMTELIGYSAAAVGTSLMLPQVFKAFRTKRLDDVSSLMLLLYLINCLLWLAYGIMIEALPVIVCNLLALVISILLLFLKSRYGSIRT